MSINLTEQWPDLTYTTTAPISITNVNWQNNGVEYTQPCPVNLHSGDTIVFTFNFTRPDDFSYEIILKTYRWCCGYCQEEFDSQELEFVCKDCYDKYYE